MRLKHITLIMVVQLFVLCALSPTENKGAGQDIQFGIIPEDTQYGYLKSMKLFGRQDSVQISYWSKYDSSYDDKLGIIFTEQNELWDNFNNKFEFTLTTASDSEHLKIDNMNVYLLSEFKDADFMYYLVSVPARITDSVIPNNKYLNLNRESKFIKITYQYQYSKEVETKTIHLTDDLDRLDSIARVTDSLVVLAAMNKFQINFQYGDSAHSITNNLTLPTNGSSGIAIQWSTNDTNHVKNNGIVTLPDFDEIDVILTATITRGKYTDSLKFPVTLKGNDYLVARSKAALNILYSEGDSQTSVTRLLYLQKGGNWSDSIRWASSDTNLITPSGAVIWPENGKGDALVTLTATIRKGLASDTIKFILTVKENKIVSGTFTDLDGNTYKTLKLGKLEWLAENYRVIHFKDSTPIPQKKTDFDWSSAAADAEAAFCYYNNSNNADTINKMGVLYNYHTIKSELFAPDGWRVPSQEDWRSFKYFFVENNYQFCNALSANLTQQKECKYMIAKPIAAKTGWAADSVFGSIGNSISENNKIGFTALPAGFRTNTGSFSGMGTTAIWWSSAEDSYSKLVGYLDIYNTSTSFGREIYILNYSEKGFGYSVRIVRDIH